MVEFPEQGEIVIGKITKVLDYGVFLELLEYEGVQGFVHISNVSSSWIKNIRNFVKEGQIRAGKVIAVDLRKNQIDISFTKVSQSQQREKIEGYRQQKRSQKLIELLAQNAKESPEAAWAEVAEPLLDKYDSLYDAFNQLLVKPDAVLGLVSKKWQAELRDIVEKNFEVPEKTVRGRITVFVPGQNGVENLKKALHAGVKKGGKHVDISYEGSGRYQVWSTSVDYKNAEKILKSVSDEISSAAASYGGKAEFERLEN